MAVTADDKRPSRDAFGSWAAAIYGRLPSNDIILLLDIKERAALERIFAALWGRTTRTAQINNAKPNIVAADFP